MTKESRWYRFLTSDDTYDPVIEQRIMLDATVGPDPSDPQTMVSCVLA